jgi:arginyl-tRNA synthetase
MKNLILDALHRITNLELQEIEKLLIISDNPSHGDYSFPCFSLAKQYRKNPTIVAHEITTAMQNEHVPIISEIKNVSGYVNIYLNRQEATLGIMKMEVESNIKEGTKTQKVIIEYSSPNIAKDFKLYHIRSTLIGQALSNIYEAIGHDVTRINYLGDWGMQFGKLIAAFKRWSNQERVNKNPLRQLTNLYVGVS